MIIKKTINRVAGMALALVIAGGVGGVVNIGEASAADEQFAWPLAEGENCISVPINLNSYELGEEAVVGSPFEIGPLSPPNCVTSISRWNSPLFEKLNYVSGFGWIPESGSENFTSLEPGKGYLVTSNNDACYIMFTGSYPEEPIDVSLELGWNMTSWHSMSAVEIAGKSNVLKTTPENCILKITDSNNWDDDSNSDTLEYKDGIWSPTSGSEDFTSLIPGKGYWFFTTENCVFSSGEIVSHYTCSDTDGGKDYYTKGTCTGNSVFPEEGWTSKTDYCIQKKSDRTFNLNHSLKDPYLAGKVTECSENCAVYEYYCSSDSAVIVSDVVSCLNGCIDGACVRGEEEELPDLVVESLRIDEYHNTIVKIKNIGAATYNSYSSYLEPFINWKDLTSGKIGSIKNYRIVNIPVGGSEEFVITKDITSEGTHNLEITVDPDNIVMELNENNNSSNLSITISSKKLPDLVVTGIEVKKVIDQHLGEGIDIIVQVKNIGEGYYIYTDSRVEKFIGWNDSISSKFGSMGNYKLISILPGETKEYSIYRTGLDPDSYSVEVTIDPENIIEESNDQNNTLIKNSDGNNCLPDGTLIKLPNDPKIYIIRDCKRYWIRTVEEFKRKGYKWDNVKTPTSDLMNSLPEVSEFVQDIQEGAMIRSIDGIDIYIVKYIGNKKFKRLILNPSVFRSYGHLRWEDVVDVEEETVNSFTTSNLVRNAKTGRIYKLTANGDGGVRRHFRSISAIQRLGYDIDATYEINEVDENSYEQGEDLK